mmetsp:Transcript_20937/g.53025  ORF Transcript_20937/g.53025 Transcript_20937/m.53025 type:complete len:247 (-) Transcript_20937:595-1335(-)
MPAGRRPHAGRPAGAHVLLDPPGRRLVSVRPGRGPPARDGRGRRGHVAWVLRERGHPRAAARQPRQPRPRGRPSARLPARRPCWPFARRRPCGRRQGAAAGRAGGRRGQPVLRGGGGSRRRGSARAGRGAGGARPVRGRGAPARGGPCQARVCHGPGPAAAASDPPRGRHLAHRGAGVRGPELHRVARLSQPELPEPRVQASARQGARGVRVVREGRAAPHAQGAARGPAHGPADRALLPLGRARG